MSYLELPIEVRLEISKHLDVASLKSFRRVDRVCLATASKQLFGELELWPLIWSWTRLEAMSHSPFIKDYVDTLKFNTNALDTKYIKSDSGRDDFVSMVHRSQSRTAAGVSASDEEINNLYAKYRSYVQAQGLFAQLDTTAISHVIGGFSNLKAIVCDEDRSTISVRTSTEVKSTIFDRGIDFLPGPTLAGLKLGTHDSQVFGHFYGVFMSSKVHHLTLKHGHWCHLPLGDDEDKPSNESFPEANIYDDQRTLDLCLDNVAYIVSSRMQVTYLKRLNDCISRYTNLEMLSLSFGATGFLYNYAEILLRISASLAKLHLTRLRHLALSNVFTTEKSMIQLLQNHSTTLRVLELSEIGVGLPRNVNERESVMSLFWKIRQATFLEKVRLTGLFTNLVDEAWTAVEENKVGDDCCTQLEDFMCHRIEWPVGESLEEYLLLKEARRAENMEEAWLNALKPLWQDDSWKWGDFFIKRCRGLLLLQAKMM
jgi:hypothetical protein